MEHRLDRYETTQDGEYKTHITEPQEVPSDVVILHEERRHLEYEISSIEKIMETDSKYDLVTPEHWNERLTECRTRMARIDILLQRQKLIDEQAAIQGTIDLHCAGLIKCNTRYLEIAEELKQMEVQ